MKYILDSNKAFGMRISMKLSETDYNYTKMIEILFFSNRKELLSYIEQIYRLSDEKMEYKYHVYVKAETLDDENKVKEKHFLWYEKTDDEFQDIISCKNIGYIDQN